MANWAYLAVSDESRIYPSFQNPSFDTKKHWVLASAGCVPLLWLALFSEADLVSVGFQDKEGPLQAFAPVTTLAGSLKRIAQRGPFLNELLASNGGVAHHLGLFADYLAAQDGRYVTMLVDEIECLYEKGMFNELLRSALRGLDNRDPEVVAPLVELSTIMLERRFVTLAEANAGAYEREDMSNYFRIMGEGYIQRPPWE